MDKATTIFQQEATYCCDPQACRANDRIFVAFREGHRHLNEFNSGVWLVCSDDEGESWSPPVCVCNRSWTDDRPSGLAYLPWQDRLCLVVSGQRSRRDWDTLWVVDRADDPGNFWVMKEFPRQGGVHLAFPFLWCDLLHFGASFGCEGPFLRRGILRMIHDAHGTSYIAKFTDALPFGDEWAIVPLDDRTLYGLERRDEAEIGGSHSEVGVDRFLGSFLLQADKFPFYVPLTQELFHQGLYGSRPSLARLDDYRIVSCWDRRDTRQMFLSVGKLVEVGKELDWTPPRQILSGEPWLADRDFGYPIPIPLKDGRVLVVFYGYVEGRPDDRAIYGKKVRVEIEQAP